MFINGDCQVSHNIKGLSVGDLGGLIKPYTAHLRSDISETGFIGQQKLYL